MPLATGPASAGSGDRPASRDIVRITLSVLVIGLLIFACLWVLQPFLAAIVWAGMLVITTWPILVGLQERLGGRRWLAVALLTLAILLVLVLPLVLAISTIAEHADDIAAWVKNLVSTGLPPPPEWVSKIPLAGKEIAQEWARLAASSHEDLAAKVLPYVRGVVEWIVGSVGGAGRILLHLVLVLVITVILYSTGETAAKGIRRFAHRLSGERGDGAVVLAGQAIRAVALGVVVTAMVQSAASGIALAACGVPYAILLTAVIFMLCIAQLGPMLVLLPVAGWLYWSGDPVRGTVLVVCTVVVGVLDNVLRPALIRRGADLPFLLILAGVIGGLLSFGIIGLFVGPVVLAVTYRLLESWIAEARRTEGDVNSV